MADLITAYIEELRAELVTSKRRKHRIMAEVRDHLLESAAGLEAEGLTPEEAQREAVARFGHPVVVARRFSGRAELWWLLSWVLGFSVFAGMVVAAYGAGWLLISLSHWWLDGDPHELGSTSSPAHVVGAGAAIAVAGLGLRRLLLDPSDGQMARVTFQRGGGLFLLVAAALLLVWGAGAMALEREVSVRMLRSEYFPMALPAAIAGWVLLGMPRVGAGLRDAD